MKDAASLQFAGAAMQPIREKWIEGQGEMEGWRELDLLLACKNENFCSCD
jgi:hypothetical protein